MQPVRQGTRLPSLTSLRWFAATAVFLRHVQELLPPGIGMSYIGPQGATGVSFFFILSGFVLAWSHKPGDTFLRFYRRRIARILPAYWVTSALALPIVILLDHKGTRDGLIPFSLLQSWVPRQDFYFSGNYVAWSLSTEVFFYALFPVIIGPILTLSTRSRARLVAAVTTLAILIPLAVHTDQESGFEFWLIYINPVTRLLEFIVGICLSSLLADGIRLRINPGAAGTIALIAYLVAGQVPVYLSWVVVTLIPFSLMIFACAQSDVNGRRSWLRSRTLIALGQWSFCFYLVHQLIERVAKHVSTNLNSGESILLGAACYLSAIAAAYLLFRFIEHPLEKKLGRGSTAIPAVEVAAAT